MHFFFDISSTRGLLLGPLATSALHVTFTSPTVLPHHSKLVVNRPIEGKRCAFFFDISFTRGLLLAAPGSSEYLILLCDLTPSGVQLIGGCPSRCWTSLGFF